jgi:hypothetical protein
VTIYCLVQWQSLDDILGQVITEKQYFQKFCSEFWEFKGHDCLILELW